MSARRFVVVTMLCWATAGVAAAQTYTETTTRVISGEVVRLEPGKTIVVRSGGGEEVTYVLAPGVALPEGVEIGRAVSLRVESGADGATLVKQVTTTTLGPDGQVRKTTEITRTDASGQQSRSAMSARAGRVEAYLPGKSITVIDSKGQSVTYVLAGEAQVPSETVMGKEVTVYAPPSALESATIYEIEQDGDTIKIKAKTRPE